MHILLPILLFIGIAGVIGLLALKIIELRQNVMFASTWRKKNDEQVLRYMVQSRNKIDMLWQGLKVPDEIPHVLGALRSASVVFIRLIENRPIRLRGLTYNQGMGTSNRVSRFLRDVSKSKERDTVSPPGAIED